VPSLLPRYIPGPQHLPRLIRGRTDGFAFFFTEPEIALDIYRHNRQKLTPTQGLGDGIVLSLAGPQDTSAPRLRDALIGRQIFLSSELWGALIYRIQPAQAGLPVVPIVGSDRLVFFPTPSSSLEYVADYLIAWGFARPEDWGDSWQWQP
jgi:hypothetical protein